MRSPASDAALSRLAWHRKRDRIMAKHSSGPWEARKPSPVQSADSAESRHYNRIKRWIGFADTAIGFGLLVVFLATGWTGTLRDLGVSRGRAKLHPGSISVSADADGDQESDRAALGVLRIPAGAPLPSFQPAAALVAVG